MLSRQINFFKLNETFIEVREVLIWFIPVQCTNWIYGSIIRIGGERITRVHWRQFKVCENFNNRWKLVEGGRKWRVAARYKWRDIQFTCFALIVLRVATIYFTPARREWERCSTRICTLQFWDCFYGELAGGLIQVHLRKKQYYRASENRKWSCWDC